MSASATVYRSDIRQGDSLVWLARPNTLAAGASIDGNWVCRIGVYTAAGVEAVAPFDVTDKYTFDGDEHFVAALTRQHTAALDPGKYLLAIDVRNDSVSPSYSDESLVEIWILDQLIAVA